MAHIDYCQCSVCEGKSFYDANLDFEDVAVGSDVRQLPMRCGDYAGLCVECAKTHKLVAVKRDEPVTVEIRE